MKLTTTAKETLNHDFQLNSRISDHFLAWLLVRQGKTIRKIFHHEKMKNHELHTRIALKTPGLATTTCTA